MKTISLITASVAALLASTAAQAAVVGSLGNNGGAAISLSSAGLGAGGSFASLVGGTVYSSDQPFADIPAGSVYENKFLAAGPTAGTTATLTFAPTSNVNDLTFLWGSPDLYNSLTITSTLGAVATFDVSASSLNFAVTNGNQGFSQYVTFKTTAFGEFIQSVKFTNVTYQNAFEAANFSVSGVPEASTWAMMVLGLGVVGLSMRRRAAKVSFA